LKTDFKFDCIQDLYVGVVNTVQLGVDSKYKPNGEMIGDNTPKINTKSKLHLNKAKDKNGLFQT
jgi:hypothetical protein